MARIRHDLVGSVLVTVPGSPDPVALTAGMTVPDGIELGDHVLESGDPTASAVTDTDAAAAASAAAAKAQAKADKKAAKKAAADAAGQPPVDPQTETKTADPATALTPPPLHGGGSSTAAWRDYAIKATRARGLEIKFEDGTKREDIIAALTDAGIPTAV